MQAIRSEDLNKLAVSVRVCVCAICVTFQKACLNFEACTLCTQAIYSEDISKKIGNEPVVQALKELMKYEMAMLVTDEEDDKTSVRTSTGKKSNHDNVSSMHMCLNGSSS